MNEDVRKEIEEIIGKMKCPKDFICYRSGFEKLCEARDFGIEDYLECMEPEPTNCKFSLAYGTLFLCKCPLRYYLARHGDVEG